MSKSGDGGSRTLVQTRNPHGFYMLIPLLVFVPRKGTNALNATLSPKASPCCRSADKAIPKLLSTPGSGRNQESPPAGCLVPSPCEGIKPVIYCASIRQRERSCFRQLLFCSQDLRASLRGSTCLHDNSSCCQNHTSPNQLSVCSCSVDSFGCQAQRTDCKNTANFNMPQGDCEKSGSKAGF